MITAILSFAVLAFVLWKAWRWLRTNLPDADFDNVLTDAEAAERKLVSDARSAGAAFKSAVSQRDADPNKPKV